MIKECPFCGSIRIVETLKGGKSICLACESFLDDESKPTVFQQITASPEKLAENLVYCVPVPLFDHGAGLERWYTVFSPFDATKYFRTKEEAIAATLEKLKEVCDDPK